MAHHAVLCVLCGLPGSGKSTLSRDLCASASTGPGSTWDVVHVEFDALEAGLEDVADGSGIDSEGSTAAWHEARRAAWERARAAVEPSTSASRRVLVVLDDNMHYRSMRKPFLQLAREQSLGYVEVHLSTSKEEASRNNACRQGQARVPQHVIDRMAIRLEGPTKGARHVELASPANAAAGLAEVWNAVELAAAHPEEDCKGLAEQEAAAARLARVETRSSQSHQLELQMRKAVGSFIAGVQPQARAGAAKHAAASKSLYLQTASSGTATSAGSETEPESAETRAGAFAALLQSSWAAKAAQAPSSCEDL